MLLNEARSIVEGTFNKRAPFRPTFYSATKADDGAWELHCAYPTEAQAIGCPQGTSVVTYEWGPMGKRGWIAYPKGTSPVGLSTEYIDMTGARPISTSYHKGAGGD